MMPGKEDFTDPAKQNPFVHMEFCDVRHMEVNKKLDQILFAVKGNPSVPEDMGMMGDLRDIKRDKKWIYAMLTIIGAPTIFLIIQFLLKAG
jgi:hypothetical protein